MVDARAQVATVGSDRLQRVEHREHQLWKVSRATVGEPLLGELPNALIGVELGGVGGEPLEVQPLGASAQLLHQLATMRTAAVPEHEDVASDLLQQLSQEVASLELPDVLGVELEVKVQTLAAGRHRDARDDGDPIPTVEVMHRGRLPHGCPGAGDGRGQLEARFVGKDEVGTQPLGVFFTLGHSCRRKRRISVWLRSRAFFCGFWWLHPSEWSSLPT